MEWWKIGMMPVCAWHVNRPTGRPAGVLGEWDDGLMAKIIPERTFKMDNILSNQYSIIPVFHNSTCIFYSKLLQK